MSQQQNMVVCPSCGAQNRATARFCSKCRQPLQSPPPSAPEPVRQVAPHDAPESKTASLSKQPAKTERIGDDKRPLAERTTRRLAPTGFSVLPAGALVRNEYEVKQMFFTQPSIHSYLVVNSQTQFFVMFESDRADQFAGERVIFERGIQHPALATLVNVFDEAQFEEMNRVYVVTEYPMSPATNLGTLNEFDMLSWGAQLASALEHLHTQGFAHGNLQPASIVKTGDKQVKLWNLNNVRPITPELRAADVYQLAVALYQLATPQGQQMPALSPAALQIFQRALAQDPRQRFLDARALGVNLESAVNALRHPEGIKLTVAHATDVGRKRELNEDALLVIDVAQSVQQGSQAIGLFLVADGMGGAAAGEVASKMVTEAVARETLAKFFAPRFAAQSGALDYAAIIKGAAETANREINQARAAAKTDMGSTLVGALVVGNQAFVVNVGDSRAYRIAPDHIEKITRDHSLVQTFVDTGQIGEDDVYTHPQRNFILRNVGDKPQINVDAYPTTFEPGQYLLLCSDGLWEMVYPKARLHEIVTRAPTMQDACKQLIDAANAHGGDDNITLVLVKFEKA